MSDEKEDLTGKHFVYRNPGPDDPRNTFAGEVVEIIEWDSGGGFRHPIHSVKVVGGRYDGAEFRAEERELHRLTETEEAEIRPAKKSKKKEKK